MDHCLFAFLFTSSAYCQPRFKGHVFVRDTSMPLAEILVENLNNKQSLLNDSKGRFSITANIGDMLRFSSFVYQGDTLLITDMSGQEVFSEDKDK